MTYQLLPWRHLAACRGMDPDLFAPTGIDDVNLDALATCDMCPVRGDCYQHAQAQGYAVWCIHGGQLPDQWAFRDARVTRCGHCATPMVVGKRARGESFCDNRCRFRHRHLERRAEHGEVSLFDLLAEMSA